MYESGNTKANVLAAARELFAARGYDNTSIRAITALAKANLGAVTYHFVSKENLYHEVLKSKTKPLQAELAAIAEGPGTSLTRIEAFTRRFFEYLLDNREMPALLLQELSLDRPVPEPIRETMSRVYRLLTGLIHQGQTAKNIVEGNPALLAISTIAQPVYAAVMRRVLLDVADLDLTDRETREQIIEHFLTFVGRGLGLPEK